MCQRVIIAMAVCCKPKLIIADEPTTALDVTVQAQVLELLKELQRDMDTAILLITHNLGVVWEMCDKSWLCMPAIQWNLQIQRHFTAIRVIHIHGDFWILCRNCLMNPRVN